MGEHIMAGTVVQHTNGKVYEVMEIRLVGGRNVAMGQEVKDDGHGRTWNGPTRVLALDKLTPVVRTDAELADAVVFIGVAYTADTPREEVLGTDCHVSPQDMANLTGQRWEDSFPTVPTVDEAHAEMMAADGGYEDTDPTDLPPARPLSPNSDASPITTDDLRQCRRELRRKVAIHCSGQSRMTAGSLSVALRTLAALDRAITGETAARPVTGTTGALSGPSEPGPLGIYDRQGSPKRSRRRRRHEDRSRAPRSIFRARADRNRKPGVQGGQAPRLGFSAN